MKPPKKLGNIRTLVAIRGCRLRKREQPNRQNPT